MYNTLLDNNLNWWMFCSEGENKKKSECYLTIIPLALMGSESIAHSASWAIDSEPMHEGERNNCF